MNTTANPRCPRCNRPGIAQGDLFKCRHCGGFFDNEPDEGGDYADGNPARRMEREEERRERRAKHGITGRKKTNE